MSEENPLARESGEQSTLDERLSAYYGPPLREQPLATSSWEAVRAQLAPRRSLKRQFVHMFRRRHTQRRTVPALIQNAFAHIAYEARLPYAPSMLAYRLKFAAQVPAVHVSLLSKHPIKLILPVNMVHSIEPAELDALLATGLARYLCMRKPAYTLLRLLLSSLLLLVCVLLALFQQNIPRLVLPIAMGLCIVLCAVFVWLLHMQRRSMSFRADTLMVLWLGRNRACQGLHALADRSRTPARRQWGEPALRERIERVCGIRIPVENERLTLVR